MLFQSVKIYADIRSLILGLFFVQKGNKGQYEIIPQCSIFLLCIMCTFCFVFISF
jgi:hypothetical protein